MTKRYRLLFLGLPAILLTACGESSNSSTSSDMCWSVSQSLTSSTGSGTDPLLADQWHLVNTGQTAYSSSGGTAGEDIDLPGSVWSDVTGQGVTVAVLDTSIDYNHPDLFNNLNTQKSCHFTNSSSAGDHATSVAGIIAAEKDNAKGGAGVAPDSTVIGLNILNSDNTYAKWSVALGNAAENAASAAVFNQSFGYSKLGGLFSYDSTFHSYYLNGVTALRNGKGALYFKAAGNYYTDYGSVCTDPAVNANSNGLPCQNANMDPDNNVPFNMVISAVNASGTSSSYSSTGSSVIFSAPGGEYGTDSPAIITPDDLNNSSSVNGHYGYTAKFNGTSSATPMASGVAALILEKNPNLGWRDVRHILLTTADKIDISRDSDITLPLSDGTLTTEPGWTQSKGNTDLYYHNWYGFGRLNAQAAVNAAASYGSNLATQQTKTLYSGTLNTPIPDNSITPASNTLTVAAADALTVESVQISVSVTHTYLSDLQVQLTSPNGMISVLMTPRNGMGVSVSQKNMVLLSQAFYSEGSTGNWKLEVFDTNDGDTGTLHSWSMTIYGH